MSQTLNRDAAIIPPPRAAINAVILAGGYSRRMGRDKALVLWRSLPMLERVHAVARSLQPQISRTFVLSAWNDRYNDLNLPGCEFLDDAQPGAGPLVALSQALQSFHQVGGEVERSPIWILLLACDLPSLDREHLGQLCERAAGCDPQNAQNALAIVPRLNDRWEPLCGLYCLTVRDRLQAFIEAGGRSFQRWFDELAAENRIESVTIDATDRAWLHNCNTPDDLPSEP